MSYCWKVLIPLAFMQIFLNGLVLVYKWPDGILLITSGAGLALAFYIIHRVVGVEPRTLTMVRSPGTGRPPAAAASAGAEAGG